MSTRSAWTWESLVRPRAQCSAARRVPSASLPTTAARQRATCGQRWREARKAPRRWRPPLPTPWDFCPELFVRRMHSTSVDWTSATNGGSRRTRNTARSTCAGRRSRRFPQVAARRRWRRRHRSDGAGFSWCGQRAAIAAVRIAAVGWIWRVHAAARCNFVYS